MWCFNTQPPEGGWFRGVSFFIFQEVSTHSRLKAAGCFIRIVYAVLNVSTHSRLKAAGKKYYKISVENPSFNTQPPEGGWSVLVKKCTLMECFNTQPPEGGWAFFDELASRGIQVSTHSRLKAAGIVATTLQGLVTRFQHTAA